MENFAYFLEILYTHWEYYNTYWQFSIHVIAFPRSNLLIQQFSKLIKHLIKQTVDQIVDQIVDQTIDQVADQVVDHTIETNVGPIQLLVAAESRLVHIFVTNLCLYLFIIL